MKRVVLSVTCIVLALLTLVLSACSFSRLYREIDYDSASEVLDVVSKIPFEEFSGNVSVEYSYKFERNYKVKPFVDHEIEQKEISINGQVSVGTEVSSYNVKQHYLSESSNRNNKEESSGSGHFWIKNNSFYIDISSGSVLNYPEGRYYATSYDNIVYNMVDYELCNLDNSDLYNLISQNYNIYYRSGNAYKVEGIYHISHENIGSISLNMEVYFIFDASNNISAYKYLIFGEYIHSDESRDVSCKINFNKEFNVESLSLYLPDDVNDYEPI